MKYWIYIEREWSKDLMVGPFPTKESAEHAMVNAILIDGFCEEDCLDCYVTAHKPSRSSLIDTIEIDLGDPDHTGVGDRDDDAILTILTYERNTL